MGRGRQKAKQTKVARELKYHTSSIDVTALQRELGGGHGYTPAPPPPPPVSTEDDYDDPYAAYVIDDDDDDDGSQGQYASAR